MYDEARVSDTPTPVMAVPQPSRNIVYRVL
jgi:hypothetical protein